MLFGAGQLYTICILLLYEFIFSYLFAVHFKGYFLASVSAKMLSLEQTYITYFVLFNMQRLT